MDVANLSPGTNLHDQFRVLDRLGIGGFGVVYKAEQVSTGQKVAIKFLLKRSMDTESAAADHEARFEREMKLLAALNHPNIVKLIDFGVFKDHHYMALEYVEGEELADMLKRQGRLDAPTARRVMLQTLEGLAFAHSLGIVHRDLKPQNIMLTGSAKRRHAKLLDFGIANLTDERKGEDWRTITRAGMLFGTPAYMSPEQIRSQEVTPVADIYAMGLILIECLTGRPAVDGDSPMEICFKQITDEVAIPPAVRGGPFGQVIEKAIAKEASARFQSCEEMLEALELVDPEQHNPMVTGPVPNIGDIAHAETGQLDASFGAIASSAPNQKLQAAAPTHHTTIQVEKKSSWGLLVGLMAALVMVGMGVIIWLLASSKTDEVQPQAPPAVEGKGEAEAVEPSAESAAQEQKRARAAAVEGARTALSTAVVAGAAASAIEPVVVWQLSATPAATVHIGDQQVCPSTPCELERPAREAPLEATLRAAGFKDATVTLVAAGGPVNVNLSKTARERRRRRSRRSSGSSSTSSSTSAPSLPEFD